MSMGDRLAVSKDVSSFHCCFMSTDTTVRLIRDGEPRTATSTLTDSVAGPEIKDIVACQFIQFSHESGRPLADGALFKQGLGYASSFSQFTGGDFMDST